MVYVEKVRSDTNQIWKFVFLFWQKYFFYLYTSIIYFKFKNHANVGAKPLGKAAENAGNVQWSDPQLFSENHWVLKNFRGAARTKTTASRENINTFVSLYLKQCR